MKIGNLEVYGIIYKITNKLNGKVYIGQTTIGFIKRYSGGDIYRTHNKHLKRSIKKDGIENFEISKEFDIAFSKEELNIKEITWIDLYNACDSNYGYNKRIGGTDNIITGTNAPWHRSVVCVNTGEVFNTITEAYEKHFNNIKSDHCSKIVSCCKGNRKSYGTLNCVRMIWMYLEDYNNMKKEEIDLVIEENIIYSKNFKNVHKEKPTGKSKKVVCLNTINTFDSVSDAERYYGLIVGKSKIPDCCNDSRNYCGKIIMGANTIKLAWSYYDDYLEMTEKDIVDKIEKANKKKISIQKKIICLTTNKIFDSISDANIYYNIKSCGNITRSCQENFRTCGRLEDGTPLKWMYYDEYIKQYPL